MNPKDIKAAGLKVEQAIHIRSHFNGEERQVNNFQVIPLELPSGCCASYFPETNPLVPLKHYAKGSMTPASKSIVIEVIPITV